jgi:hypothetical protein
MVEKCPYCRPEGGWFDGGVGGSPLLGERNGRALKARPGEVDINRIAQILRGEVSVRSMGNAPYHAVAAKKARNLSAFEAFFICAWECGLAKPATRG